MAPKRVRNSFTITPESSPAGALMAVTEEPGHVGEKLGSSPNFCTAARWPWPTIARVVDKIGHPQLLDVLQRFRQRQNQRSGRRPARFARIAALLFLLQIEVIMRQRGRLGELPRLRTHRHKCQSGRNHKCFLRSADHHVETPAIDIERHRPEASDRVDHQNRARLSDCRGHSANVMRRAGGCLRRLHENRLRRGLRIQRRFHLRRRNRGTVGLRDHVGIEPVSLGDLSPPLAEFSSDANDYLIAAREKVRHRRVHGSRAGRGKHQHVVRGAHHFLQVGETRSVDLARRCRSRGDEYPRRHHGMQGRRIQRRGARC